MGVFEMDIKRLILIAGIVALSVSAPVLANTVTLDPATIQTFTFLDGVNTTAGQTTTNMISLGIQANSAFSELSTANSVDIGSTSIMLDSSATFLSLDVSNINETFWDFELFVTDGVTTQSGAVTMTPDGSVVTLTVDLAGLDLNDPLTVFVRVNNPMLGDDVTIPEGASGAAEFRITSTPLSVPEPGTLLLLGLGLLGIPAITRLRN